MAQHNPLETENRTSFSGLKKPQNNVIIRHAQGGQLRANPANHQYIDHKGGHGDWSKWNIQYEDNNQVVLIQNQKTRKYMTIDKRATEFLANGEGVNIYCRFRIHYNSDGLLQLESLAYPGNYMSVKPHQGVVIEKQANASSTYFQILMHGISEDDTYFVKPYDFEKENVVIIRHPHNGGIAVIQGKLSDKGTKDKHSRWITIPQMSPNNYSTNGSGAHHHYNKTNSMDLTAHSSTILNNTNTPITSLSPSSSSSSSSTSVSTSISKLENGNTNVEMKDKEKETTLDKNSGIVNKDASLENNSNNPSTGNDNLQKETTQTTQEKKSSDDNLESDAEIDNPEFIPTVKFRHEDTQKYLIINENREIGLTDQDNEYCLFRVHIITKPNVVKFESWKINGAYIDVREGGVIVGKGGPHSQMTVLKKQ